MPKALDITNQRFGRLTAINKAESKSGKTYWLCKCDCGTEKEIQTSNLTGGRTISCGCITKNHVEQNFKEDQKIFDNPIHVSKNNHIIGIYKITNLINNKIYIGQSVDIMTRFSKHKAAAFNPNKTSYNGYFYRSIRKYGIDNFEFSIIESCLEDSLNDREKYWIKYFNSTDKEKGYNITTGGDGSTQMGALSDTQIEEITQLLLTTTLTQKNIADRYGVCDKTISSICMGKTYRRENLTYPLRTDRMWSNNGTTSMIINNGIVTNTIVTNNNCISCGKTIGKGSEYCMDCWNISQRKVDRPMRDDLKQQIRTIPFTTLGKKYNVSDNAIRKWCKIYNLPHRATEIKNYSDQEWELI